MHSLEQSKPENNILIRWQNLVMPYIEMVRDGLYSISFNGKSFCIDERCIHRIYRSGWISFDRETHTFRSGFEYPALGSIIEDIVRTNYFSNN